MSGVGLDSPETFAAFDHVCRLYKAHRRGFSLPVLGNLHRLARELTSPVPDPDLITELCAELDLEYDEVRS